MLPRIADYTNALDKKLWERIKNWQNTPYTKTELRKNRIAEFSGWWFAISATISSLLMNFLSSWYVLITSAIIGFVIAVCINEKK